MNYRSVLQSISVLLRYDSFASVNTKMFSGEEAIEYIFQRCVSDIRKKERFCYFDEYSLISIFTSLLINGEVEYEDFYYDFNFEMKLLYSSKRYLITDVKEIIPLQYCLHGYWNKLSKDLDNELILSEANKEARLRKGGFYEKVS